MFTFFTHERMAAGWGVCLLGLLLTGGLRANAEEYRQGFDDKGPHWTVQSDQRTVRVLRHGGQSENPRQGQRCEGLSLESPNQAAKVQLEYKLPAARAIEELRLRVWIKAGHPGAGLFLRIVYPNQTDPRTGKALFSYLRGETYRKTGDWERLEAGPTKKMQEERARQLRSELNNPNLNLTEAYVDRAIITSNLPQGRTEISLDELQWGPIVSPAAVGSPTRSDAEGKQTPPRSAESGEAIEGNVESAEQAPPMVDFRLDRLLVKGRPFFPRIAAYHGEPIDSLKLAGLNVVWVQNYEDTETLEALREQGLWAMATPPRAVTATGKIIDPEDVSIIPFTQKTNPILLWNLGTRVPSEARDELLGWVKQIRSADRDIRRPVMVDILGGEEAPVSRRVNMLGLSRHIDHTTFAPKTYRQWLGQKMKLARPGTFTWTWIQTEPSASTLAQRNPADSSPVVIEPEQIRLQVYAALAAGCRGIGYWKTTSLVADAPGAFERQTRHCATQSGIGTFGTLAGDGHGRRSHSLRRHPAGE